jgi:hypothetical protein
MLLWCWWMDLGVSRGYAKCVPYLYRREAKQLQEAALDEDIKASKTHSTPYPHTPRPNLALTYYSLPRTRSPRAWILLWCFPQSAPYPIGVGCYQRLAHSFVSTRFGQLGLPGLQNFSGSSSERLLLPGSTKLQTDCLSAVARYLARIPVYTWTTPFASKGIASGCDQLCPLPANTWSRDSSAPAIHAWISSPLSITDLAGPARWKFCT